MADNALDADVLRRDRQRYQGLVEQADGQIAAWQERAGLLQQAVEGFDRLLALAGNDPARDSSLPPGPAQSDDDAFSSTEPGSTPPAPTRKAAPKRVAPRSAKKAPPPTANPAAPDPIEPPAAASGDPDAPKGTEALRLVLESEPARSWALPDLLDALSARGWLPTSRRPEEGVRISLKRLTERGGAVRTDDGRWQALGSAEAAPAEAAPAEAATGAASETWPSAEPPDRGVVAAPAVDAAPAAEETNGGPDPQPPPSPPPSPPLPVSFGRPVGGTVTEL